MTSRQYGLEIPIEGRDEISKALQQAQALVQRATQQLNRDLESTERQIEDTGRAAETAGQRIRRSLTEGMNSAGQAMRSAGRSMSHAGQFLTTGVTIPLAAAGLAFAKFNDVATSLQVEGQFRRTAEGVGLSADRMMTAIRTASGASSTTPSSRRRPPGRWPLEWARTCKMCPLFGSSLGSRPGNWAAPLTRRSRG